MLPAGTTQLLMMLTTAVDSTSPKQGHAATGVVANTNNDKDPSPTPSRRAPAKRPTSAEEAISIHGSCSLSGGLVVAAEKAGPPQQQLPPRGAAQGVALHVRDALDAELCKSVTGTPAFRCVQGVCCGCCLA
jgi:hypothetical protein